MSWKQTVKDYLTFSKKDRIAAICIIVLLSGIYFLPKFFSKTNTIPIIKQDSVMQAAMDTLQQKSARKDNSSFEYNSPGNYQYEPSETASFAKNGALFTFDPNTLPTQGWQKLGLNDRIIHTINNYRSKGGKFYKPEDLLKIWGMPEAFYERVKNYINITPVVNHTYTSETPYKHIDYAEEKKARLTITDVNATDTTALIALPGIGSKLAFRIINFRDKLGGFHSVDQIAETYGLPDSTFQKIKPYLNINANNIKKININAVTKDDLKTHPYIRWNLANAIVEYRNQHGNYKSLDELKNIVLIDEATYNKIEPYLSIQ